MKPSAPPNQARFNALFWRLLLLPVVLLVGAALLLTWAAGRVLANAELVRHTDEIISHASQGLKLAVDMESGVRGYQINGDPALLQPYLDARVAIDQKFAAIEQRVLVPEQLELLEQVRVAHRAWAAFGAELIQERDKGGNYQSIEVNRRGKALFDIVRARFADFIAGEETLKRERAEVFATTNRRVLQGRVIVLIGLGVGLGLFTRRQMITLANTYRASEATAVREAERAHENAAKLQLAHAELEQRVDARTSELKAALEKAQEVDRLKSEFLATMSHELRTPLNSIIGFTEIVVAGIPGELNAEQKKQLQFVHGSATHLLHLINDLLDLARIESGRVEPAWEDFSPREVIEEALNTTRPLADRKKLKLVADLDLPEKLRADRKMFFQVLLNLLANSVKFTERGEVRLTVRCEKNSLVAAVRDTGIGIKPEQMPLLFEAFRQVDGSVHRRYEGTGLGLYLCMRIMALLGGTIAAESKFGAGSTFTFTLPLSP